MTLWLCSLIIQRVLAIPNLIATLYYAEHVYIAQTRVQIPTLYLGIGQESKSESVPVSECGNVFKPQNRISFFGEF